MTRKQRARVAYARAMADLPKREITISFQPDGSASVTGISDGIPVRVSPTGPRWETLPGSEVSGHLDDLI